MIAMIGNGNRLAPIGLLTAALILSAAVPALADTDYRCLADCIRAGNIGASCMASCSYLGTTSLSVSQPLTVAQKQTAHSPFVAPAPTESIVIAPPESFAASPGGTPPTRLSPTTQPLGPSTNYKCVNDCLGNGYQYGLCVQRCSY